MCTGKTIDLVMKRIDQWAVVHAVCTLFLDCIQVCFNRYSILSYMGSAHKGQGLLLTFYCPRLDLGSCLRKQLFILFYLLDLAALENIPLHVLRVFGVLPMVPLVDNICTIGTNGITILIFTILYQLTQFI